VPRFPRLRRFRRRPINESNPPLKPAPTPATDEKQPEPAEKKPEAAKPEPEVKKPEPEQKPKPEAEKKPGPAAEKPKAEKKRRRRPSRGKLAIGGAVVLAAAAAALIGFGVIDTGDDGGSAEAPAPQIGGGNKQQAQPSPEQQAPEDLGFPAFATGNTTRVGGSDPTADAAGAALAAFPSQGGSEPPNAVALVGDEDWQGGIAAAALTAPPVRAPVLVSQKDSVPAETAAALSALQPPGSVETGGAQVIAVGDVQVPGGLKTRKVGGATPAARADALDLLRDKLGGADPQHVVVVSDRSSAFSMPAAAWAARSGDVVLFTGPKTLPKPTARALKRHEKLPVYVLGPSSVVSSDVLRQIDRLGGRVRRVSGEDPVSNAIAFARYADGTFGWDINDPGHGFVVARSDRPLDAAAAAPLSAGGTWGPLLLTDSADTLPGALRGYLLDVKPGYQTDPTRALYNHVWVIGDQGAIDVPQQAEIDDLAELAKIGGVEPAGGKPQGGKSQKGGGKS
jgi:hypothetical protein